MHVASKWERAAQQGGLRGAVSLKGGSAKRLYAMRSPAWAPGVTE